MPNIKGTSAFAPHAAGVVALLLEIHPELQAIDIQQILPRTSIDILQRTDDAKTDTGIGFDFDSGYGLINARSGYQFITGLPITMPPKPLIGVSGKIIINDSS